MTTDTDEIAALRRAVQPVIDEVLKHCIASPLDTHPVNRCRDMIATAAMAVVAQARADEVRRHHVHVLAGSGNPHCHDCPLAAAEALVERLYEKQLEGLGGSEWSG